MTGGPVYSPLTSGPVCAPTPQNGQVRDRDVLNCTHLRGAPTPEGDLPSACTMTPPSGPFTLWAPHSLGPSLSGPSPSGPVTHPCGRSSRPLLLLSSRLMAWSRLWKPLCPWKAEGRVGGCPGLCASDYTLRGLRQPLGRGTVGSGARGADPRGFLGTHVRLYKAPLEAGAT